MAAASIKLLWTTLGPIGSGLLSSRELGKPSHTKFMAWPSYASKAELSNSTLLMAMTLKPCSIHGVPTHVLSDPMTAFIAGAKVVGMDIDVEIGDIPEDFEESDFEATLERKYNIDWTFIPAGSQWRDPAERTVKSLKTMMQTIFNTEHNKAVLTINEYWSIFSQCSEILNRRLHA